MSEAEQQQFLANFNALIENLPGEVFDEYTATQKFVRHWRSGPGKGRPTVQIKPCVFIDPFLQHCHSCAGMNAKSRFNPDMVCQFEGFRKIIFK